MIIQDIIKLPKLQTHVSLMGRKISKLPDKGQIIVQGHRQKPYPVQLTHKTKYNWKELVPEWNEGAKYTAMVDTDTQPWTVYSIQKVEDNAPINMGEIYELGGDY